MRAADQSRTNLDEHGNVVFTLFTRRGNKPQTKAISVPQHTALAAQTRAATQADLEEQAELKRRVLNYERQAESSNLRTRGPERVGPWAAWEG